MKRCPTCGNTYTNDGLVFCLEDGAKLTGLSNPSFDPEATLRISVEENPLLPTEAARPQGAQTVRQPATPLTVPPRPPQATNESQTPSSPAATPAQPQKSTSPFIVAGITAIVVLLLVIAGIGIALLVRDSSQNNNSSTAENNNRAGDRETNRNTSNTANDGGTYNSANRANSNIANRNTSSTDSSGSAEAKVVRGAPLYESDLAALSRDELRRLRNAVYARHGRTFDSVELQRYFETRPWYRPRSDYNEASLTGTDLANIKLIQAVENTR
ncbi:MAG TPA: YARHG domain-containing protein [Pyrinomonadaceae bacterium]|nr:YARHG domain-containing protein [Pyrinomonadaceae bacterium]